MTRLCQAGGRKEGIVYAANNRPRPAASCLGLSNYVHMELDLVLRETFVLEIVRPFAMQNELSR